MSDSYTPITQGLRRTLGSVFSLCGMDEVTHNALLDHCNNIDAIHKALEEQNAKLHEKVLNQRKQLAEVQEAIERRNNGVLKRRWQKKMDALKKENEELRDFTYRVREATCRHEDITLWGTDYMALPLDADGVPIHVGDWITGKWGTKAKVVAVTSEDVYWWEPDGCHWCHAFEVRHHHEPTVEDVLREFYTLAVRGKEAHAEDVDGDVLAEYAAKLRLAGDAE